MTRKSALVIGYGRLEETLNIIQKLKENSFQIYLSLDGPRTMKVKKIQDELCHEISIRNYPMLSIRRLQVNLGVAGGVVSAIDWFFSQEDEGLILEDDLIIDQLALSFLIDGIAFIKNFPKALMASGSRYSTSVDPETRVSWTHIPLIWGWSTTREKWQVMRNFVLTPLAFNFKGLLNSRIGFFQGAAIAAASRRVDTWDSPLAFRMLEKGFYCLVPPANLITNIGSDQNAVHTVRHDFPLFNPTHDIERSKIQFSEPQEKVAKVEDERLFSDVFKIKSRNRLSAIKQLMHSRGRPLDALGKSLQMNDETKTSKTLLVLVHLGESMPKILCKNLKYLEELGQFSIVLITDARIKRKQWRLVSGVRVLHPETFLYGWKSSMVSRYRDGFWEKSKQRLYVLMNFCLLYEGRNVMHIESDVWLSPGIDHQPFFKEGKIRFTKINNYQASGAIMYIKDSSGDAVRNMKRILIEETKKTDMQILAQFTTTFPNDYLELKSKPHSSEDNFLFDPAMVGMHLFGEDPRNRFGKARIFASYSDHDYNLDKWNLIMERNSLMFRKDENLSVPVVNLHIHSKNTTLFSAKWENILTRQLAKRIRANGESEFFRLASFFSAILDYLALTPSYLARRFRFVFKLND